MATNATTPNSVGRHNSLLIGNNTRKHSVRTNTRSAEPPNAPVFLDAPLFAAAMTTNTGGGGGASTTKSNTTTTGNGIGGVKRRLPWDDLPNNNSKNQDWKKFPGTIPGTRVVMLDPTSPPKEEQPRQAKKLKTALAVGNPNATTSTTTGDTAGATKKKNGSKRATATTAEGKEKQEKLAQESAMWRAKYKKAFPSFTFYFDTIDEATKAQLGAQVKKLGSSVDQFFSKKVTHVVTSRSVTAHANKENVDSPAVSSSTKNSSQIESAVGKTKKQTIRSPNKTYSLLNGQKLRAQDEKNPFIDPQDILSKAIDFKLKIWHLDKLNLILTRINSHSPNKTDASLQRNPSLPSLLRDEELYGTRERDPFVPRSDMHYFPNNKYHLLVEDSTGEHRPIVIQEYNKPRKDELPSWPILYGGIEGRSGFYRWDGPPIKYYPKFDPRPYAERTSTVPSATTTTTKDTAATTTAAKDDPAVKKLFAGFSTTAARAVGAPNLRRAISLQNVPRAADTLQDSNNSKHAAPGGIHRRDSYIAASGNSQIITSNTGTSTRSGAAMQSGTGKGSVIDKRLAVLANRTVSVSLGGGGGGAAASSKKENEAKLRRSVSVDSTMTMKKLMKPKAEEKKPGYCENCRIKYDDFKTHVVSNKHRRFAMNEDNWTELDDLLSLIARRTARTDSVLSPSQSSAASSSSSSPVAEDSGFYDAVRGRFRCSDDADEDEDDDEEDEEMEEEREKWVGATHAFSDMPEGEEGVMPGY
ncbi:protein serine/threonine kinase activating protein DBF4 [Sporobolomyces salmoneus]|uniref:protein serine/threonine kinase activating protein DBF4 n=1 Tax=Sporobolomyces salmoneus TaxID=183962 RepID=UPI0031740BD0